ncbi:hypothetical protein RHS04_04768 [Rhizoctonia solani]|uniref:BTB domain-containing protein n=1 Tax=Rhizoctonia solani TaxID=456999 RepID=A0A8H7LKX7_9AGAM|nr:hypothetical protein RHS04_04768 [Rhizoctonia solani]
MSQISLFQTTVHGTQFETHRYLVKRFRGLESLLDEQPAEIRLDRDNVSPNDFRETFKVLYATIFTGPFVFATQTLISTLRVASTYDYHELRDYCVHYLETLPLDAVKRIELAREFDLPGWEEPAYRELEMRDEAITREEAKAIGLDAFVRIAESREREQRRRGKVDPSNGEKVGNSPTANCFDREQTVQSNTQKERPENNAPQGTPTCARPSLLGNEIGTHRDTNNTVETAATMKPSFTDVELNGVYTWRPKLGYRIEIPGCKCRFTPRNQVGDPGRVCYLSPCATLAFKNIQVEQLAHANRISSLESSMKKLDISASSSVAPPPTRPTYATSLRLTSSPHTNVTVIWGCDGLANGFNVLA